MKKTINRLMFLFIATAMCITQMRLPLKIDAAIENLALKQSVAVSGLEVAGKFTGDKAVDGERYDRESRWSSANINSPQWLSVDFKKPTTFNTVKIFWEASAGKSYKLQVSDDNQTWKDIYSTNEGPGSTDVIQLAGSHTARYLRIYVTEGNGAYWSISIFEFEVYNYTTDAILEDAKSEITVPESAKNDFPVVIRSSLGAEIAWTSNAPDIISINNATGIAKVTKPEENTEVTLEANITYQGKSITKEYVVNVLSEESINATYQIYPTPQNMKMTYHKITLSDQVNVVMGAEISELTKSRVMEVFGKHGLEPIFAAAAVEGKTNLYIGTNGSSDAADVYATEHDIKKDVFTKTDNCFDNHLISINEDNTIVILGKDNDAAYYALATLDQVLSNKKDGKIATALFEDYAKTRYRGIVEGFYGFPYSTEDRLSLMDYMKDNKMNTFIYGPKADPYHLGNWKDDYPLTLTDTQRKYGQITQDDLRAVSKKAADNNIDFVWSAHPAMQSGIDFTTEAGVNNGVSALMKKYEHLYDLGIRQFGIFVDDIDLGNAYRDRENHAKLIDLTQKALDAEFNKEGTEEDKQVQPLFFVPSFYALDFGGATQRETYLKTLRNVDEKIIITFTGAGCWSNVNNGPLLTMKNLIGRTPAMWWNYPVNDNIDDQLYLNPINSVYSVSNDTKDFQGLMSNPMNQAEASKLSLFGVADFSWNPSQFNAQENWEHSFATYSSDPKIQAAIRTFSLHSGKTKDFSGIKAMYDKFKADVNGGITPSNAGELSAKMIEIIQACDTIKGLQSGDDQKLAKFALEVRPWVNKLRAMATIINDSITVLTSDNTAVKWAAYTEANELYATLHTTIDHKVNSLEGQGTSVTPSQFEVMPGEVYTRPFADYIIAKAQAQFSALPQRGGMEVYSNLDKGSGTLTDTKGTIRLTSDVDVTLQAAQYIGVNLHDVKAINSSISELPEGLVVEGSINGKEWFTLNEADLPIDAVYVRVKNVTSEPITWDVNNFVITYKIGVSVTKTEASMKLYETYNYPLSNLTDGNLVTFVWTGEAQAVGQTFTLTLDKVTPLQDISLVFTGADCLSDEAVLEISNDKATWEAIGTLSRAELDKNNYTYEVDATGKSAQYVRLRLSKVTTNSWLKFNEFSINKKADQMIAKPIAYAMSNDKISSAMESADRNLSTKFVVKENSTLTYQLIDNKKISNINLLYRYLGTAENAPIFEILDDEGWKQIGTLDGTESSYDVAQYRNLKAARVTCTDQPIEIYEIYEEGSVYQEADRAALKDAIANVPSKEESAYTVESYAVYKAALQKANDYYAAVELSQADADLAAADLAAALAGLKMKTEDTTFVKSILKSAIDKAVAAEASAAFETLAPGVKGLITRMRTEAQAVYANVAASTKQCMDAWMNLANALQFLDFQANKAKLFDLIEEYKDIDPDDYTIGVEEFKAALANALSVHANDNVLQVTIDAACARLQAAKEGLKNEPVNKSLLEIMISGIEGHVGNGDKYNKESSTWAVYVEALADAKAMLANAAATQAQVDEAVKALGDAYQNIRLLPSEEQLAELNGFLNKVKGINRRNFTSEQLAVIDETTEKVKAMINDFDVKQFVATQKEMATALDIMNTSNKPGTPGTSGSANAAQPNTGDNTNIAALAFAILVSGCGVVWIRRKHNQRA